MAVKASTPLEKLKEQLTCVVCLDFYTNPKTLPCLHSFCLQCLEGLPLDPQGDAYYIACPTCRHRTQLPPEPAGASGFLTAFHLNSLMEIQDQMNKAQQSTCPRPNHQQQPLNIFCETCNQVICIDCTAENHKDHNWNLINKSYSKHRHELEEGLVPVKERVEAMKNVLTALTDKENEIGEQGEIVKERILAIEEDMIRAIHESARQLTRKVETVISGKVHVLSEQKKLAEMSLGYLKDCEVYVEESIKKWEPDQVLMSKKHMVDHMIQVTKQANVEEYSPLEKAGIQLIGNSKVVKGVKSKLRN